MVPVLVPYLVCVQFTPGIDFTQIVILAPVMHCGNPSCVIHHMKCGTPQLCTYASPPVPGAYPLYLHTANVYLLCYAGIVPVYVLFVYFAYTLGCVLIIRIIQGQLF